MIKNNSTILRAERIFVLDALRGFALLGVIFMHVIQHFGNNIPSTTGNCNFLH